MNEQTLTIDAKRCHIFGAAGASVCILCGMENHRPHEIADTAKALYASGEADNCRFVVFETSDWNGDFSPWPSAPAFGSEPFAGNAPATLAWLRESLLPRLKSEGVLLPDGKCCLAGYSLSGLFALWAFWECELFDGAASCSGSLWLPGWMNYLERAGRGRDGVIYLSLGSREERTKNSRMAAVGDNTRKSFERFRHDAHITASTLEWNRGGHFSDPTGRLVKGLLWLLRHT